jgi:hypothetical protein
MAMIDQETQGDSAASADAPVNRDARREPGVIEGEVVARETGENEPPRDAPAPETAARPEAAPPAGRSRTGARGFLGGALAGLIVSALAAGAGYTLLASKADVSQDATRLSEVEAQARRDNSALAANLSRDRAAVAALDKRVSALEASAGASNTADLDKRVRALEAANADNGPNAAAAADAAQRLATQVKSLQADVDAARGEIPDLSTRVGKLESETQKASAAGPDLAALAARVDKIETTLAAPKTETRAAPETPSAADNAAPIAIIAGALADKLGAGAPFGSELAELERLGVDPAKLAPLRAVADGAPTGGALAASFHAVAPKVLAAASPAEQGGVTDRFLAHLHDLVRVRNLNETAGDDPPALASQIEALSRRGDVAGALSAFNKLPESSRQAAGDWLTLAGARQAADSALQSIREAAITQLAAGPKP